MVNLVLTGQQTATDNIQPKITQFRNLMEQRKVIWQKLPPAKRRAWVISGKDPIMTLAWQIYKYLRNNFFEVEGDAYD